MAISSSLREISCYISLVSVLFPWFFGYSVGQLSVGFYDNNCPDAEAIVNSVVRQAVLSDPTLPAGLLRLHFHDCFVQGCDGSILIMDPNGRQENRAFKHQGLRGFGVIDQAKTQLEDACPGVVSCADIVALAARDSIFLSNGPSYQVPTGRKDGLISNVADADNMPDISDSVETLKAKFRTKGLSEKDLVVLTGAHTIGTAACFFLEKRLYNFSANGGSDPLINPEFLPELMSRCPQNGDVTARLPLDEESERSFDTQILRNIREGFGVIETDARLYSDESTKTIIDSYLGSGDSIFGRRASSFETDFADSIVRMGMVGVKAGSEAEIRRVCSAFN